MTLIEWEQKEHKMTAEMNQSSQFHWYIATSAFQLKGSL